MSYKKKVIYEIPIDDCGFGDNAQYIENEENPDEAVIRIKSEGGGRVDIPAKLMVKIAEAAKEIRPEFGMEISAEE